MFPFSEMTYETSLVPSGLTIVVSVMVTFLPFLLMWIIRLLHHGLSGHRFRCTSAHATHRREWLEGTPPSKAPHSSKSEHIIHVWKEEIATWEGIISRLRCFCLAFLSDMRILHEEKVIIKIIMETLPKKGLKYFEWIEIRPGSETEILEPLESLPVPKALSLRSDLTNVYPSHPYLS